MSKLGGGVKATLFIIIGLGIFAMIGMMSMNIFNPIFLIVPWGLVVSILLLTKDKRKRNG